MTTRNEAREAIYAALSAAWSAAGETAALYFENEEHVSPETGPWARLVVRHDFGDQVTLGAPGNRKFRRGGTVLVQVFVPLGAGMKRADELTEIVRSAFEGKTLVGTNLVMEAVYGEEQPREHKWHATLVRCRFTYEETR